MSLANDPTDFSEDLSILLSSPYCWKASRHCSFWNATFNNIKPKRGMLVRNHKTGHFFNPILPDRDTDIFLKELEDGLKVYKLWPKKTWDVELTSGANFFDVLKKYVKYQIMKNIDQESLVSLSQLIRNSHEHVEAGMHPDLIWYIVKESGNKRKKVFDEFPFTKFWIARFPTYSAFMWNGFRTRSDQLRDFYQNIFRLSPADDIFFTPLTFVCGLQNACKKRMEAGHLKARFTVTDIGILSTTHTVELRPLDADLIGKVQDKSTVNQIVIKDNKMEFKWSNSNDPDQYLSYDLVATGVNQLNPEEVTYVFTNAFLDEQYCILDRCLPKTKKVVVFVAPNSIEKVVTSCKQNSQFREDPIGWTEISSSVKENLQISVQNRKFPLMTLSAGESSSYDEILSNLNGDELNALLENKEIELLDKYEQPKVYEPYIPRRIYNRAVASSKLFYVSLYEEIFVIFRSSVSKLNEAGVLAQSKRIHDVFPKMKLENLNGKVFVVEDEVESLSNHLSQFKGCSSKGRSINVHFFESIENDKYEWLHTSGTITNLEPHLKASAKESGTRSEKDEFRESLEAERYKKDKVIFIANEPGMGKSEFSNNFSNELKRNIEKTVLVISMNAFMNDLEAKVGTKAIRDMSMVSPNDKVVPLLCERLCTKGFKCEMFAHLLRRGVISLELMLDGLDEVKSSVQSLAFQVIKLLQSELPQARIWVTLREHLLETVRIQFGKLGYALEPFGKLQQMELLVRLWSNSLGDVEITEEMNDQMNEFAEECISKCLSMDNKELAGIPLQCRIMGEVFEKQVLERKFNLADRNYSIWELYEMFLERKLELYVRRQGLAFDRENGAVKVSREYINSSMMALAVKLLFPEFVASLKNVNAFLEIRSSEIFEDVVLRHGIVTNLNPPNFLHRTFAEYLAAAFVVKKLKSHLREHENFESIDADFKTFFFDELLAVTNVDKSFSPLNWLTTENRRTFRNIIMLKFMEMQLENMPLFFHIESEKLNYELAKLISSNSSTNYLLVRMSGLFEIVPTAVHCRLRELVKLLLILPNGPFLGLLYAIYESNDVIFDHIISNWDPESDQWKKVTTIEPNKFGLLHHIIYTLSQSDCDFKERYENLEKYLRKLVKIDASLLEQRNDKGETPLLYCVRHQSSADDESMYRNEWDSWTTQELLLEVMADINAVDNERNTLLHKYASNFELDYDDDSGKKNSTEVNNVLLIVEDFKRKGFSKFNVSNTEGLTPMLMIFKNFNYCKLDRESIDKFVDTFINCGTNINVYSGSSVLHQAVRIENGLGFVESLIERGANVNAVDSEGNTVLHSVCTPSGYGPEYISGLHRDLKYVDVFVKNGYDKDYFNKFNDKGLTPLLNALEEPRIYNGFPVQSYPLIDESDEKRFLEAYRSIIETYVNYGTKINATDENDNSVLHQAVQLQKGVPVIKCLIAEGAKVDAVNKKKQTIAHIAHESRNLSVFQFLLKRYRRLVVLSLGQLTLK